MALGTSKINYLDPRISVSWCKRNEVTLCRMCVPTRRMNVNACMQCTQRSVIQDSCSTAVQACE